MRMYGIILNDVIMLWPLIRSERLLGAYVDSLEKLGHTVTTYVADAETVDKYLAMEEVPDEQNLVMLVPVSEVLSKIL